MDDWKAACLVVNLVVCWVLKLVAHSGFCSVVCSAVLKVCYWAVRLGY